MRRFALSLVLFLIAPAASAQPNVADPPACGGENLAQTLARADPAALERGLERARREIPNAEGLLWRIEKPGLPLSHLFGTAHTTDARATELPAEVSSALKSARTVAVEIAEAVEPGQAAAALGLRLVMAGIDRSGTALSFLTDTERATLEKTLAERGLPAGFARLMRPWLAITLLGNPPCEVARIGAGLPIIDALVARGRAPDAELVSLETADEQLAMLRDMPEDLVRAVLSRTLRHAERLADMHATLIGLYLERRPAAIIDVAVAAGVTSEEGRALQLRYVRALGALGGARDRIMAERALPLLERGGVFIGVGALHLAGEDGLIERFRRAGFTVTRVW